MASIVERIAKIEQECSGVWAQSGVTSWERDRLAEWRTRPALSAGQDKILREIERKVFRNDFERAGRR